MITVKKSEYNKAKLRKLFKEASQQYIQITEEEAQELGLIEQTPTGPTGEQEPETPTGNTEPETPTGNTEPQGPTGETEEQYYTNMYNNIEYEVYEDENNDIILNISNFDENNIYDNNISKCCLYIGIIDNNGNIIDGNGITETGYSYGDKLLQQIKNGKNIIQLYMIQYAQKNLLSYNTEYYVHLLFRVYYKTYNSYNDYSKGKEKQIIFTLNNDKSFYKPNIIQYPQFKYYISNYAINNYIFVKPLIFTLKNNEYTINNFTINDNRIEFKLNEYLISYKWYINNWNPSNRFPLSLPSNINYDINTLINNIKIINNINYNINVKLSDYSYYISNNINNDNLLNAVQQIFNCQKEALIIYTNYEATYFNYYNYENNYIYSTMNGPGANIICYDINMIDFEGKYDYYPYLGQYVFSNESNSSTKHGRLPIHGNLDHKIKLFFTINNIDFICVNCGWNAYDENNNLLWTIDPITGEKTIVNNE